MFKTAFLIFLFFVQGLSAVWDEYNGEQIVLFSLAPGTGDQYRESCEEQKLPRYIQTIAKQYPDIKVKIIAIDPLLSTDPESSEYAFLGGWEHDGVTFKKDNIEIQFYSEYIPDVDEEYLKRVESYFLKVVDNGGVLFIGHHTQAYYAFEPFRIVHNRLNIDNVQMYICCADFAPFSTPKVYWNNPCSNEELSDFFDVIFPHINEFFSSMDVNDKEACHSLLNAIMQNVETNFIFYRDMVDLPYKVIRSADGSLQIINAEAVKAVAA